MPDCLELLLPPCQRDGDPGDWWGPQHKHCTGSHHISPSEQVWCTCECHRMTPLRMTIESGVTTDVWTTVAKFFDWLTANHVVLASQQSGKPTVPCPHTGKGQDQMYDEGLTKTPKYESRAVCKVCGADVFGLDLYGHLPLPGLPEGYYPNNVPVETLIREYRKCLGGGFIHEPAPDPRDAEISRLRDQVDTLCVERDAIAMLLPLGEELGPLAWAVEQYIGRLRAERDEHAARAAEKDAEIKRLCEGQ